MELKVSSKSVPNAVAGAIVNALTEAEMVEITVVGAGALNQAIKATAIARGYIAPSGKDVYVEPSFKYIKINDEERTSIKLVVRQHNK